MPCLRARKPKISLRPVGLVDSLSKFLDEVSYSALGSTDSVFSPVSISGMMYRNNPRNAYDVLREGRESGQKGHGGPADGEPAEL